MGLKINRIDLKKSGKAVAIEFDQSEASRNGDVVDSNNKKVIHKTPHDDLSNAFIKLTPHFVHICELGKIKSTRPEYYDEYKFLDEEEYAGFNVTGVVISGKDRDFVKLLGTKTTSKKEVIAINAPLIWLDDQSEKRYPLSDLVRTCINAVMNEGEKYYQGKYQPSEQVPLPI